MFIRKVSNVKYGQPETFLGIKNNHNIAEGKVKLKQKEYIKQILSKYGT